VVDLRGVVDACRARARQVPAPTDDERVLVQHCLDVVRIDTREFAGAWLHLLNTTTPQRYPEDDRPSLWHIVGEERSNLDVAHMIADIVGKPLKYEPVSFHASRPGHDLRYALDGTKLADAGWRPTRSLEETLRDIVTWYVDNPAWLKMAETQP